jgi:hypothetical protein
MENENRPHDPNTIVVNQPPVQREFVQTESVYVPESRGFSGLAVAALVIGAVALVTVLFLVILNNQSQANDNATASRDTQQQQPIVVQQPAAQQPVVVQQPGTAPAPIVVQQPAAPPAADTMALDTGIQTEFERQMMDNDLWAGLSVTANSVGGTVTLKGTVASAKLKADIEKMARAIKGVKSIDNQITVSS